MTPLPRRRFLSAVTRGAGAMWIAPLFARSIQAQEHPRPARRMTLDLTCGAIGVSARQLEAVELAHAHGFESVEARGEELARMSEAELSVLMERMRSIRLAWGAAGLSVDFRGAEDRFKETLAQLPKIAAALQRAGVRRVGTWISPASDTLTYLENFNQHARRLGETARVLGDHGLKLGLEYVGTPSGRIRRRYGFVHSLAETRELIEAMKTSAAGVILDSWHWWIALDTVEDILKLKGDDVVVVDLNDAPTGLAREAQRDNQRELPAATGVIDVKAFLGALERIGYAGPVRAEPFNRPLNDLDNDAACAMTIAALRKAFGIGG